jgi:signal transduction histidine kinase/CheY-like chemotaxis protein
VRLRVLLVEDSLSDALLLERKLLRGGYEPLVERVDQITALTAALGRQTWDVVISDFMLGGWTGMDALRIVRERDADQPFILVSGAVGEETAVEAIKAGANDYLLKDRLARLPTAVAHALEEAQLRRERRRARAATAFLAAASVRLNASLDPGTVAATLVELVVPTLADAAVLDLVDEAGRTERAAESGSGCRNTATTSLPLTLRGEPRGVLHLYASDGGARPFGIADGAVGQELVARAVLALENARLYRRAQDAIATRDEFMVIAAHELRTPLTPLSLQLQTLVRTQRAASASGAAPPRLGRDLETTLRHVERLTRLVDQLLDVSQLEARTLTADREDLDLAALVTEIVDGWRQQANESGCALSLEVPGPTAGRWDRVRLGQMLGNLLSNALKFGAGKPVAVTLERAGDAVRLQVRDSGPGIAAADRPRIFDRFSRAVSVRRYGGFGLGLWVVRQVVDAHGGTIDVTAAPEGGTLFTIELPLAAAQHPAQ